MISKSPSDELDSKSKENEKLRASSNLNKHSSLVRLAPKCSIHQRKIEISNSKVPFFYLSKPLQVTKPCSKKITRINKATNLSLLSIKSSTIPKI